MCSLVGFIFIGFDIYIEIAKVATTKEQTIVCVHFLLSLLLHVTLIFKEFPSFLCLEWTPYLTLVILPILGWILVGFGKSFGCLSGPMLGLNWYGFEKKGEKR